MKHINIDKVKSFPFRLTSLFLFISLAFMACKDDTEEISIVAEDFITSVDEYPMPNQDLGKIVASTNEGELTYYIVTQSPANSISLDAATGQISVKFVSHFDYQKNQSIEATVRVSNGSISENVNILINIENINDVEINDFTTSMYENPEEFQVIGAVSATAEEGNIIYSIVSQSPDNSFSVNPNTGELQVISPSHFNYDKNQTITGQIMAESAGATDVADITINLLKPNPGEFRGDLVINNQAELDQFIAMEYTYVYGHLTITDDGSGDDIKSLDQLSSLTKVNSFTITGLDHITDLKGLENLTNVGMLSVTDNRNLLNLDAMVNLQDALSLVFTDNLNLDSYCGLQPILSKHNFFDLPDAAKLNTIPPRPPKVFIARDNKSNPKVAEILALDCD